MKEKGIEFLNQMKNLIPEEFENFVDSLQKSPLISIRIHPKKQAQIEYEMTKVPWCDSGFYLNHRPSFTLDPLFHAGGYYVQEPSSMFLGHVLNQILDRNDDPCILDLCAAPGGKSSHILSFLNGNGLLVANENIKSRANILYQNICKWGFSNCLVTNNDPSAFERSGSSFDCILIDAPCSGEGMIRKDQRILDKWTNENVEFCSSRQKRIIGNIINNLNDDGYLIYSTCTYNEKENIENCIWMKNEFGLEAIFINIEEEWNLVEIKKSGVVAYQFYPHKLKGEGFFISVFKINKNEKTRNSFKNKINKFSRIPTSQLKIVRKHLHQPDKFFFYLNKFNVVYAIPKNIEGQITDFNSLNIIGFGIELGKLNKEVFIPSHSLALSTDISKQIPMVELTRNQALLYLKGEPFSLSMEQKGWLLVCYKDLPLGWIKSLDKRVNNYYPKEFRIRMSLNT